MKAPIETMIDIRTYAGTAKSRDGKGIAILPVWTGKGLGTRVLMWKTLQPDLSISFK